jgi:hypothetical protein
MSASNAIHGKTAAASIGGTWLGGVTYAATITRDTADVSCFGDKWGVFVAGLPRVQGTFSGLHTLGGDSAAAAGMTGLVRIDFYVTATLVEVSPGVFEYQGGTPIAGGMAYVSSGVEAAVNDAVRVSGSFVSTGEWTLA